MKNEGERDMLIFVGGRMGDSGGGRGLKVGRRGGKRGSGERKCRREEKKVVVVMVGGGWYHFQCSSYCHLTFKT